MKSKYALVHRSACQFCSLCTRSGCSEVKVKQLVYTSNQLLFEHIANSTKHTRLYPGTVQSGQWTRLLVATARLEECHHVLSEALAVAPPPALLALPVVFEVFRFTFCAVADTLMCPCVIRATEIPVSAVLPRLVVGIREVIVIPPVHIADGCVFQLPHPLTSFPVMWFLWIIRVCVSPSTAGRSGRFEDPPLSRGRRP